MESKTDCQIPRGVEELTLELQLVGLSGNDPGANVFISYRKATGGALKFLMLQRARIFLTIVPERIENRAK